ncbi:MAG TPA: UbiD family decarboxylase [Candidatus Binatia bacterium]|nr:UbiD family decarboxylase [Candidatus Binatia bacterium]
MAAARTARLSNQEIVSEAKAKVTDLRGFIEKVRQETPEDVLTISREVDPRFEITALVVKLEQERRFPILVFEKVKGTKFQVVTNVHASRRRLAAAIGSEPRSAVASYLKRIQRPISPKEVGTGPVKEVILQSDQVDVSALPQIVHHEGDAGPYLTAAVTLARDPLSGRLNCSFNRLMFLDKNHTSIHLTLAKHLWEFYTNAEKMKQPLELAVILGAHPAWSLGALNIGSIDEEEFYLMGSLADEPMEVVRAETMDLLVPARAEMILEGEILPFERVDEGPFGEFTGYSLGSRKREIFHVKAITHRKDAFVHDIAVGHLDHLLLSTIPMEANLFRAVRAMVPSVKAVRIPAPFTVYVSIEKKTEGQGKNAILAVLGADLYMKHVIVVDHDIDIFNDQRVQWAVGTRCQADRDVLIVSNAGGSDLDPSDSNDGVTAKMGIDATAKPRLDSFTPKHRVPQEVLERLDLKDFIPASWLAPKDGKR